VKKHTSYNPSLTRPIIDVVVAVLLIVAASYTWYHTHGIRRLDATYQELMRADKETRGELAAAQKTLQEAQSELQAMHALRKDREEYLAFLQNTIAAEQSALEAAWERDRPNTEKALALQAEIRSWNDRRRAFKTDIIETDQRILTQLEEVNELESQLQVEDPLRDHAVHLSPDQPILLSKLDQR